jgi:hypothetical protein
MNKQGPIVATSPLDTVAFPGTTIGASQFRTRARAKIVLLVVFFLMLTIHTSPAQLAITEVMSSAIGGPDFWELSNYGDEPVDLTGYSFNDGDGIPVSSPFLGLISSARGTIVFVQQDPVAYSTDSFRQWWGLNSNVPIVFYTGHGLAQSGDDVRLWSSTNATDENLVHSISFPQSVRGVTFFYNPASDIFDALSSTNMENTFKAATSDDIGSPGTFPAPVPPAIAAHPTNTVANAGDAVTFSVGKRGLPSPSFQWFFNDVPIPGARFASLVLTNVQLEHQGAYHVVLSNLFGGAQSTNAVLMVNLLPTPPRWLDASGDLTVFAGQSRTFHVMATGVPQPAYQWYFNGVAIQNAAQDSYTVKTARISDAGTYSAVASNANGAVTNAARLVVTSRPDLRITEVMTSRTTNNPVPGRDDWWELTNFETDTNRSVDLFGYCFDDDNNGARGHISSSWTNREHVIMHAGESVIFVKNISSDTFKNWWGHANLPVNLQIITYPGGGLGLNTTNDVIYLWNPGATEDSDVTDEANWFTTSLIPGVSFTFDLAHPEIPCCDVLSVEGVNGAVAAAQGGDIGSPGYLRAPTEVRILSVQRHPAGCFLTWRTAFGGNHVVQCRDHLTSGDWIDLTNIISSGTMTSYMDATANGTAQRFYRVVLKPTP